MDTDIGGVLAALRGQQASERSHGAAGRADVWAVPASVGPDLTRPAVLGEIAAQWPALDDAQKANVLLGIAHVGQTRMRAAAGEARRVAQLAREDAGSDWVRTLGGVIGDVGVTGRMCAADALDGPVRADVAAAVAQVAAALERASLRVVAPELSYMGADAARAMAPPALCAIYGHAPPRAELERVMARAALRAGELRSPATSRRPSAAVPDGSAASSQLGSPEPAADMADESAGDSEGAWRLPMTVRRSHRADHVERLARLLAAANSVAADARPAPADVRPARGGATGLGVRRGASAGGSKLGMIAPRRRTTANAALPGAGLGATRRADDGASIRMAGFDDAIEAMGERDRLLRERREKAAEERELKRQERQAAADERKRRRDDARQQRQAAAAAKRQRASAAPDASDSADAPAASSDDDFDVPLEYRTFAGDSPDRQALYTSTNALSDAHRKLMYCFFKGLAMPPDTGNELKFVLNEAAIDDPRYPGRQCTELMLFKANLINGKWDKIRRLKR
ncbi:hypothetical protein H4S02_007388 [Coemansia sp. RSA 2611]|nr:hypothetical protein LPJ70_002657 [Coemansia sp. RSA 2708]KAJ2378367.1 hypothetical protein H4S02_007388 [Coemansia sp. RSA 2611]